MRKQKSNCGTFYKTPGWTQKCQGHERGNIGGGTVLDKSSPERRDHE